jgi:hypothetical protein
LKASKGGQDGGIAQLGAVWKQMGYILDKLNK